jgi:hypothetical protein
MIMANSGTTRMVLGILISVGLSFFSVYFFNMLDLINQIEAYAGTNLVKVYAIALGSNFRFDFVSVFTGTPTTFGFFIPQIVVWFILGYISGTIAKGSKRGITASFLVIVIVLLLWITLSIFSQVDLMALFSGSQLIFTLGGLFVSLAGGLLGGIIGGKVSGPFQGI